MNTKTAYETNDASLENEKVAEVRHLKKSFGDLNRAAGFKPRLI